MNAALNEVVKNRRIRFEEVRSEGKLMITLLCGWKLLPKVFQEGRAADLV
jgi:hypothetical protein